MTVARLFGEMRSPELSWDFMRLGFSGRCISLAVFGVSFALLIVLGYGLRDNSEVLTIMWPASGLLLVALWSSPARNWIWILAIQLTVQIALYFAYADRANWQWGPLFAIADSVDGIVGAAVARRMIAVPSMPRIRPVMQMIASIAIGSAVSAIVGAFAEGFGLWSVAERIREAAGELTVDTAPGRGCRVSVVFPLTRQVRSIARVP